MVAVVIVGTQWGDEGKGKVVDFYAQQADVVVRFNGGDNAGHTVGHAGKTWKLHHIPSGVLSNRLAVIGNGCVVNPKTLIEKELAMLRAEGIQPNLVISARAHVVLPYHIVLDEIEEKKKGKFQAGTTKRGIGPCYSDKAARFGIRMGDLLDRNTLREKLHFLHELKVRQIESYGGKFERSEEDIFNEYMAYGEQLRQFVGNASAIINQALDQGKRVLFEGAQGTMLDIDHGMYPFGTSSSTTAGGACTGAGVGPGRIDEVIGVVKAYTSRVGAGPLPTEITDETAQRIRDKGGEYGTTTGRPRRIGWLDLVTLKYAKEVNGLTGLAFTRVDTLAGISKVKLCVAYELDGKRTADMPQSAEEFARCKPVYEEMPGWKDLKPEEWRRICMRGYFAFPDGPKNYIRRISEHLGLPVYLVSVGPDRESTISLKEIFAKA